MSYNLDFDPNEEIFEWELDEYIKVNVPAIITFLAEYGTTTYAEVSAALTNNNEIVVEKSGVYYLTLRAHDDGSEITLLVLSGNKQTSVITLDDTDTWGITDTTLATASDLATKQDTLVSGTNIKTINSESVLGSGNIDVLTEDDIGTAAFKDYTSSVTSGSTDLVESGAVHTAVSGKQDTLVSGSSIKTINGNSVLGSGNIAISGVGNEYVIEYGLTNSSDIYSNFLGGAKMYLVNTTGFGTDTPFPVYVDSDLSSSANVYLDVDLSGHYTGGGYVRYHVSGTTYEEVESEQYLTARTYVTAGQKSGTTLGSKATAEGNNTTSSSSSTHAEGNATVASSATAHAEGNTTTASGNASHSENSLNVASGASSHAEGQKNEAGGHSSHAEGQGNSTSASFSHVEGSGNHVADTQIGAHVFGVNSDPTNDTGKTVSITLIDPTGGASSTVSRTLGKYAEMVGNGDSDNDRSNARTLDWDGNEVLAGKLTVGADPTANLDVATKQYVDLGLFGTCTTAANTQTKEVSIPAVTALTTGVTITVLFTNGQGYNGTPKLKVNSLDAKDIYTKSGTAAVRYTWEAGSILTLTYDGTGWVTVNRSFASTTYYGITKLMASYSSTSTSLALVPRVFSYFANNTVAPYYDTTATYEIGDIVRYESGMLYVCTTAIPVAEAFDDTHWTEISLKDFIPVVTSGAAWGTERRLGTLSGDVSITLPATLSYRYCEMRITAHQGAGNSHKITLTAPTGVTITDGVNSGSSISITPTAGKYIEISAAVIESVISVLTNEV